jgi:hypothetical protein
MAAVAWDVDMTINGVIAVDCLTWCPRYLMFLLGCSGFLKSLPRP